MEIQWKSIGNPANLLEIREVMVAELVVDIGKNINGKKYFLWAKWISIKVGGNPLEI